jgi:hypothetical protein
MEQVADILDVEGGEACRDRRIAERPGAERDRLEKAS